MKRFKSSELIDSLQRDVKKLIEAAQHMQQHDPVKLSYPPEEGKWSVAQALEHLNMYNRHYLPLMEKLMMEKAGEGGAWFNPGRLGNYFTRSMMPSNVYEVKNKMKGMKAYNPERGLHVETVFREFLDHQQKFLQLLEIARKRDLENIRVPITLSRFVRLKLGDMFRFLIAHEQRHMVQARNVLRAFGISTDKFPVILEAAQLK
jgi:hypothetical protein